LCMGVLLDAEGTGDLVVVCPLVEAWLAHRSAKADALNTRKVSVEYVGGLDALFASLSSAS
jgi:hypothetical protein